MQFIEGHSLDEVLVEVARLRQNGKRQPSSSHSSSVHPSDQRRTDDVSLEGAAESLWKSSAESDSASSAVGGAQTHNLNSHHRPQSMRLPVYESSAAGSESCYWLSVAKIGIQVAEALAYAAREGVLHRDIKPSNLMLDMRGMVWVTDFGLAKALGSDDLTRTGDIVGTLRYMAPERFRGQSDQRSDIYGLGVTLYELITLRHPFDTNNRHRLVRQIEQTEPARPRAIDRTVPRDLETIVLKAMAKHPGDRYANAELMANDLRLFLTGQPIMARPVGVLEWFWRWCRRNPALASLIATVLLLCGLLASAAVVTKMFRDDRDVALRNLNRAVAAERLAVENQRWEDLAFSQTPNQAIITSSDLEDRILRLPTTRTATGVSLRHDGSEYATAVEKGPLVWWNLRRVKAGLAQLGNATASSPIDESSISQHDPWSPALRPRRIELRITDELVE